MRTAILADAGPLYAAVDPQDAQHRRALEELQRFARERREIKIAYPTLLEAYSLVLYRLGRGVAARWLAEMGDVALVNPASEDYRRAFATVRTFTDQRITLFDATVAAVATRLGLEVWTYDYDFEIMRAPLWRQ